MSPREIERRKKSSWRRGFALWLGCLCTLLTVSSGCGAPESGRAQPLVATDLEGHEQRVLELEGGERPVVLLFVAVDCPISNSFAPEVKRIREEYAARGVTFLRIYSDPDMSPDQIRQHGEDFGYVMPAMLDFEHALVQHVGATVVPTAALFSAQGEIVYRGRIDDRFVDFGKQRAAPTRRDLRLALDAVLAGGRPEVEETEAVGCFISELLVTH